MKSLVVYEFGVAIRTKQLWESENWENIPIHPVVLIIFVPMKQDNLGIHRLPTTPKNLSSWLVCYIYIVISQPVMVIYQLSLQTKPHV